MRRHPAPPGATRRFTTKELNVAMFNKSQTPVINGFIRSFMATRLWVVKVIVPYEDRWLVGVLRAGHVSGNIWHPPGRTQCSGYGSQNLRWLECDGRRHFPVVPGKDMPEMPEQVKYILSHY
jgi:hypothetical protein